MKGRKKFSIDFLDEEMFETNRYRSIPTLISRKILITFSFPFSRPSITQSSLFYLNGTLPRLCYCSLR